MFSIQLDFLKLRNLLPIVLCSNIEILSYLKKKNLIKKKSVMNLILLREGVTILF